MPKITFMGAGSTVFARNVLGDCMCLDALKDSDIALYDIDAGRLQESAYILGVLNKNINGNRAKITTFLGPEQRKAALDKADFVVNAIQVGGFEPSTVIDFEIPKKIRSSTDYRRHARYRRHLPCLAYHSGNARLRPGY